MKLTNDCLEQAAAVTEEQKPAMVRNAVYEEAPSMFDDDGNDSQTVTNDAARQVRSTIGRHQSYGKEFIKLAKTSSTSRDTEVSSPPLKCLRCDADILMRNAKGAGTLHVESSADLYQGGKFIERAAELYTAATGGEQEKQPAACQ